jgi:hypothetical protein
VSVLVLFDGSSFHPFVQFLFSIFKKAATHRLQAIVKVLQAKDQADTAGKSFNLSASVPKFSDILLHACDLVRYVEMRRFLKGRGAKRQAVLLTWMDEGLNSLLCSDVMKDRQQRGMFVP